jgi:hypothetical protein
MHSLDWSLSRSIWSSVKDAECSLQDHSDVTERWKSQNGLEDLALTLNFFPNGHVDYNDTNKERQEEHARMRAACRRRQERHLPQSPEWTSAAAPGGQRSPFRPSSMMDSELLEVEGGEKALLERAYNGRGPTGGAASRRAKAACSYKSRMLDGMTS